MGKERHYNPKIIAMTALLRDAHLNLCVIVAYLNVLMPRAIGVKVKLKLMHFSLIGRTESQSVKK